MGFTRTHAQVTLEPIVATSIRICPGAAAGQVFLHVRESATTLGVWLVRDAIRGVFIVAEVGEAALHDVQILLLLSDTDVDLASSVKGSITEKGEQLFEILHQLCSVLVRDRFFFVEGLSGGDRRNEFVVVLNFYHQWRQFQIQ